MENFNFDDYLRLSDLISSYLKGTLNTVDSKELVDWMEADQSNRDLFNTIVNEKQLEISYNDLKTFDVKTALADVNSKLRRDKPKAVRLYKKWLLPIAASILLSLSVGAYLVLGHHNNEKIARKAQDIAPGKNQATLTLANGQKIILTKGLKGTLSKLGNTVVSVNSGNSIAYTSNAGKNTSDKTGYNTLSTKKGEQSPYPLILADGTKVWLNDASTVTFPTSFNGKNRMVTVTGEAYFEVAHDPMHPFKVNVKGQTIEDIGTSFNINAYDDEPVAKTTLITGKISIEKNGRKLLLDPGQQAQTDDSGIIKLANNADLEEVLAWKNGLFKFDHANIKTIMRQLSRWYNVAVEYEGAIPEEGISGKIYKNVSATDALEILNSLKINFRIENNHGIKKIVITP